MSIQEYIAVCIVLFIYSPVYHTPCFETCFSTCRVLMMQQVEKYTTYTGMIDSALLWHLVQIWHDNLTNRRVVPCVSASLWRTNYLFPHVYICFLNFIPFFHHVQKSCSFSLTNNVEVQLFDR